MTTTGDELDPLATITDDDFEQRCPDCRSAMLLRRNRYNGSYFWGCRCWPDCPSTRPVEGPLADILDQPDEPERAAQLYDVTAELRTVRYVLSVLVRHSGRSARNEIIRALDTLDQGGTP
jgi:ssDNA-binding Zn-finger/Zn-ribbon topoisomerase 1